MKKALVSILVFALILSLCACGGAPGADTPTPLPSESSAPSPAESLPPVQEPEPEPEFDLDAYKSSVAECKDAMFEAAAIYSKMLTFMCNFEKASKTIGNKPDKEKVVENTFEWILTVDSSYTEDFLNDQHDEVLKQYKSVLITEIEGKEAEEIESSIKSMYDAYTSMWTTLQDPPLDMDALADAHDDAVVKIKAASQTLDLLLS